MKKYRWLALFLLLPLSLAIPRTMTSARHWAYDKNQPLEMSQAGVQERDGVKIYDITYKAPVGDRASLVGPNGGNRDRVSRRTSGQGAVSRSDLRPLVHAGLGKGKSHGVSWTKRSC